MDISLPGQFTETKKVDFKVDIEELFTRLVNQVRDFNGLAPDTFVNREGKVVHFLAHNGAVVVDIEAPTEDQKVLLRAIATLGSYIQIIVDADDHAAFNI